MRMNKGENHFDIKLSDFKVATFIFETDCSKQL